MTLVDFFLVIYYQAWGLYLRVVCMQSETPSKKTKFGFKAIIYWRQLLGYGYDLCPLFFSVLGYPCKDKACCHSLYEFTYISSAHFGRSYFIGVLHPQSLLQSVSLYFSRVPLSLRPQINGDILFNVLNPINLCILYTCELLYLLSSADGGSFSGESLVRHSSMIIGKCCFIAIFSLIEWWQLDFPIRVWSLRFHIIGHLSSFISQMSGPSHQDALRQIRYLLVTLISINVSIVGQESCNWVGVYLMSTKQNSFLYSEHYRRAVSRWVQAPFLLFHSHSQFIHNYLSYFPFLGRFFPAPSSSSVVIVVQPAY